MIATSRSTAQRFACPYKKRLSQHESLPNSCAHAFPNVSRLKEHLFRQHGHQFQCGKCYVDFAKDSAAFEQHRASHGACEPCAEPDSKTFARDIWDQLKNRSSCRKPEDDKWRDVYKILFPDAINASDIPSPYYGSNAADPGSAPRQLLEMIRAELGASSIPEHCHIVERINACLNGQTYQSQQHPSLCTDGQNEGGNIIFRPLPTDDDTGRGVGSNYPIQYILHGTGGSANAWSGPEHLLPVSSTRTQYLAFGTSPSTTTQPETAMDGTQPVPGMNHWTPQQGERSNAHTEGWARFGFGQRRVAPPAFVTNQHRYSPHQGARPEEYCLEEGGEEQGWDEN